MTNIKFHHRDGFITFDVRVIPRALKSEIVGEHDGALKVKICSPPVDGAANQELTRLLSKEFVVPRSSVEIVSGLKSRSKRVHIRTDDTSRILTILKAKT